MAMKLYSRDKVNRQNVPNGNSFDYQYFLLHKNDSANDRYYSWQKKALVKLILFVLENELTDVQRRVVILTKINGLKNKEAANLIGVDPSTVSRELKAAQKKFNRAYEHYSCVKQSIV